jgi:tetratricopeptide (TPR) repeat protein
VKGSLSSRFWAPWVFLGTLALLVQSGRAQIPAITNVDATMENWRAFGKKAADKALAGTATLPQARRNEAQSLFESAFNFSEEGNLEAAQIAFQRGLAIDPSNGMAEYYLADILAKLKQVTDSLPHYATAMELVPNKREGIEAEAALRRLLPTIAAARAAAMAQAAEAENSLWQVVQRSGSVEAYIRYLSRYPNGTYVALAKARIDALNSEADRKLQATMEAQRQVAAVEAEAHRQEAMNHLQCSYSLSMNGASIGVAVTPPPWPQLYIDVIDVQHVKLTDGTGVKELVSGLPDPQSHNTPWTVSVTQDLISYSNEHTERDIVSELKSSSRTTIQRQTGQFSQVITSNNTWLDSGKTEHNQLLSTGTCTTKQ